MPALLFFLALVAHAINIIFLAFEPVRKSRKAVWLSIAVCHAVALGLLVAAMSSTGATATQILALLGAMLMLLAVALAAWWPKLLTPAVIIVTVVGISLNVVLLVLFYSSRISGGAGVLGGIIEAIAVVIVFFFWVRGLNDRFVSKAIDARFAAEEV